MINFYLLWSGFYFLLMLGFWVIWKEKERREKRGKAMPTERLPKVSILIPFRNEFSQIPRLFDEVKKFNYPHLEIVLIDDHSEDDSFRLASELCVDLDQIGVIKSSGSGKKEALTYGVMKASGEIIITSDADCSFPSGWVEMIVSKFHHPQTQLVCGPVQIKGSRSWLTAFQQLDWASIALMNQVFSLLGNPIMCSGANLAFRKTAFLEINGYEGNLNYLSGDDEFLLKKIISQYSKDAVQLVFSPKLSVWTQAEITWSLLIQQRSRWASKWGHHGLGFHALAAIIPFVFQILWIGSGFLFLKGETGILVFLICWVLKILSEKLALGKVLRSFEIRDDWKSQVMTSFFHPLYVIWVGIESFNSNIQWKGRQIKRKIRLEPYSDE